MGRKKASGPCHESAQTHTPDVLIFDLFGVIAHNQSKTDRAKLVATAAVSEVDFWDAYWALRPSYDRGQLSGTQYWTSMAERLNTTFKNEQKQNLVAQDVASWASVNDRMVEILEELSATTRLALLSNIPQDITDHYLKCHKWLGIFEVRAFSSHIGYAKPQPEAYAWCLEELRVGPDQALFIDDRTENILAAEKAGIRGHLFKSPDTLIQSLQVGLSAKVPERIMDRSFAN